MNYLIHCKLKKNPERFQIITKIGLNNIDINKFHKNCSNSNGELHNPLNNDNLTIEMEKTKLDLSKYLKYFCLNTQEVPLSSKYGDFDYTLHLQQKYLIDIAIKK